MPQAANNPNEPDSQARSGTTASEASPTPHMPPEAFAQQAEAMLAWARGYWKSLDTRPVTPAGPPGTVVNGLPASPPGKPGTEAEWDAIRSDLDELITPNLLHWQSPRFFGYFPCNMSEPAILGSLVASMLNVNGMQWGTGPAITELETRMLDWAAEAFGLPERFRSDAPSGTGGGCIQGTASESTLIAMLAGRDRCRDAGARMDDLRVYASDQAHSSVVKAAMIAGLSLGPDDRTQVRLIASDANGSMDAAAFAQALREDLAAGAAPCSVTATIGTTSLEGIDPLPAIADAVDRAYTNLPERHRPWLHADAAYTGAAFVCPEFRPLGAGLERFDSLCMNPHKWLLTNFDCDLFWTANHRAITRSLSITPEYLRNEASESGAVIDYRDWQLPLGRAFRSLKLWFVFRHYGTDGLRAYIRSHVELAKSFEARVQADPRFLPVGVRQTALVCFRHIDGDAATEQIHKAVNTRGRIFLSHTKAVGQDGDSHYVLRLAIGSTRVGPEHVAEAWAEIDRAARQLG